MIHLRILLSCVSRATMIFIMHEHVKYSSIELKYDFKLIELLVLLYFEVFGFGQNVYKWLRAIDDSKSNITAAAATFFVCLDISPQTIEQNTQWHQITFYRLTNKHCYNSWVMKWEKCSSSFPFIIKYCLPHKSGNLLTIDSFSDVIVGKLKMSVMFKWVNH